MRIAALALTVLAAALLAGSSDADARMIGREHAAIVAPDNAATDISAQSRRRPARVYIYGEPRRLPPNAVRQCRAWYAPEYRLSGTVITPRMQCWWERG